MPIDPRRLRFLLAVARSGGVLAAADELRVTPSAISQHLKKLEQEVGMPVVTRTPAGAVVTPAGRILTEAADEIERVISVAHARLRTSESSVEGSIRLGGFTSFLRSLVIPRLSTWRSEYPLLRVEVVEDDTPMLMRMLRKGDLDIAVAEFDVGIGGGSATTSGIRELPLLDEAWHLVVPSGFGGTITGLDLQHLPLPWLGVGAAVAVDAALERLRGSVGFQMGTIHRYCDTATGLDLVAAGEGVALLPALALQGISHAGVETLRVPGLGTRRIAVRYLESHRTPAANSVLTMVRLLHEAVGELNLNAAK